MTDFDKKSHAAKLREWAQKWEDTINLVWRSFPYVEDVDKKCIADMRAAAEMLDPPPMTLLQAAKLMRALLPIMGHSNQEAIDAAIAAAEAAEGGEK